MRLVKDVERMENRINWLYVTMCVVCACACAIANAGVLPITQKYKIVMKFDRGKVDGNRIVMIQL